MSDEFLAEAQLPLETVGARLRRAREQAGLSVSALAAQTRISQRQIEAIEAGNYAALPGRTYAVGFSRSLARAVGLDEAEIAVATRAELSGMQGDDQRRPVQSFEPGDPARVPSARLTWLALIGVAAAVAAGIMFLPSLFSPGGSLPSILPTDQPATAANVLVAQGPATAGPVVFTALAPRVWVKFYDRAGTQLLQKELAQGESYTVPADQSEVLLSTTRPDQLGITVGGQAVPKLSEVQTTIKDVPVSAAALLARGAVPIEGASSEPRATTSSAASPRPRKSTAAPAREQRIPTPRVEASPAPSSLPSAVKTPANPGPTPSAT